MNDRPLNQLARGVGTEGKHLIQETEANLTWQRQGFTRYRRFLYVGSVQFRAVRDGTDRR